MKIKFLLISLSLIVFSCAPKEKEENINETKEPTKTEELSFPKNQVLTKSQQITTSLYAAPKEARDGATVYGFDEGNSLTVLKEGTNDFICIADNPKKAKLKPGEYHYRRYTN